jgi:4-hydroxy-tetrahydrodipicolinate reductase
MGECGLKVGLVGIGAMGKLIARLALEKGFDIVGAFDIDEKIAGRDLGEVIGIERKLGVKIDKDADRIGDTGADVAIYATVARVKELMPQILPAIRAGIDVISTCEELIYPWHIPESKRIDEEARKYDVTVFGTGINPGFAMDALPVALTSVCHEIDRIEVKRIVDISPYSERDMKMWGIGISTEEWWRLRKAGKVGMIGLDCMAYYISDCLGVKIDKIEEECKPIEAKVPRRGLYSSVNPGEVAAFEHLLYGIANGERFVSLTYIGDLDPAAEGKFEPGVSIRIYGKPNIQVELKGTTSGDEGALATTARIVNMVPLVAKASAGLLTQRDLPIGPCLPKRGR